MTDTIFALASGRGRAGVAVIRISGPGAGDALRGLTGAGLPTPRRATLRRMVVPGTGELLDRGLVLWFPGPASYTGEDMAELHLHGGMAVIGGVVEVLAGMPRTRPAEPGEFTRRAFLAGKLDLTEAEGVADLVAAETAAQRRQALRQADGALARLYDGWRTRLMRALAHVEASIDFADEDLPADLAAGAGDVIAALELEMRRHLEDSHRGERLREGVSIAIIGPPNAGKSTLLNRLAQRDAAIVSPIAGTTRDVIDIDIDLGGYPVRIADTAGLRETDDVIEAEGVRRAERRAAHADLKVVVLDATSWPDVDPATRAAIDPDSLLLLNKCDLRPIKDAELGGRRVTSMSLETGAGVVGVLQAITDRVRALSDAGSAPVLTRARHRAAIDACLSALRPSSSWRRICGTRCTPWGGLRGVWT
jgi:tRNA modification GTPase